MSLYNRLGHPAEGEGEKIAVHRFYAAMVEYLRGELTGVQVINAFSLTPSEVTEAQAIINTIDAKPNTAAKLAYLEGIHAVWILVESGDYTEAKAKSSLGF